ncbi:MAG TPA: FGGY-family carbohydrate kinase [Thermomicrobiales bacterium]|nr:FGGY-family carbohydrate kinase [Thermomicrobiales bacterium]
MPGELLLGIDVGTYSSKGVLCRPDGTVLSQHVVEHGISMPRPGWVEQDADEVWWNDVVAISRAILAEGHNPEDIAGVAVSAIGPCMLPVDDAGRPMRPGVLYGIDTRASAEIAWLNEQLGEDAILELCGMALSSQTIGPKILWLKNHEPEIWENAHRILTSSSYLVHRLTGEYVIDKHGGAYLTPLVDIETITWSDRYAESVLDLGKLPRIMWSTEIAGTVTPQAAAETGLTVGTPVTAGTIDAAAESLSVGVVDPGDLMVMYGTTLFFLLVIDRPMPDKRMYSTGYVLPGTYDAAGGMATSGALTRWFRDQFGVNEMNAEADGGPNAYAALADSAAHLTPGSDGLICLPYFAGERTPLNDPDARGVFAGLTLSHTRAHMYRAMLEGTAYGVRHNLETLGEMGAIPQRLVAVGGGAKNRLWLQIVTDVTGQPQIVPERTIGASYGNAMLAGLATGLVPDASTINREWVKEAEVVEPDPAATAIYDEYYRVYRSLYEHAKDDLHALARLGRKEG